MIGAPPSGLPTMTDAGGFVVGMQNEDLVNAAVWTILEVLDDDAVASSNSTFYAVSSLHCAVVLQGNNGFNDAPVSKEGHTFIRLPEILVDLAEAVGYVKPKNNSDGKVRPSPYARRGPSQR